ncbi:hypothetical protein CDL12_01774 [Handroanthus impetiginosus]|uniref:Uncharacterized protein n=1 Tax=Handroanthus impetiginosus TaxID=429701 RepID=A0A2G9I6V0_9LAMI|nr:hypothetical protein CDL12_01774 [Handroanthus impetiginosus]
MILLKTIPSRLFRALIKLQTPLNCLNDIHLTSPISSNCSDNLFLSSISWRPFSLSALFAKESKERSQKRAKPLSVFFKEAIGISEEIKNTAVEAEENSENAELKEKLRNLEEEVRRLNKKKSGNGKTLELKTDKPGSRRVKKNLSELFGDKEVKLRQPTDFGMEDTTVHKELSTDMQMFTHHLYRKGYLKKATFMPEHQFDLSCFSTGYARDFLKFAAVNFGRDHQEIAKWLSASDLKKVALFGCPSLGQRTVKAAKHMRSFFEIDEQQVCIMCTLKKSCKYANKKSVIDSTKLDMAHVTRILVMYALDSVPQQQVVLEDINNSVSRLLKEIVKLS